MPWSALGGHPGVLDGLDERSGAIPRSSDVYGVMVSSAYRMFWRAISRATS